MSVVNEIAYLHARTDLSEDDRRKQLYQLKTGTLIGVINSHFRGKAIAHEGFTFEINKAHVTPEHRLFLDVTFVRPPAQPVTHQITITNPPLLPRNRSGNEQEDMIAAIGEMLEGFV